MTRPLSEPPARVAVVAENWSATGSIREDLPSWVDALAAQGARTASHAVSADRLRGESLTAASRDAFRAVLAELEAGPCRVWAFLPRPTERDDDTLERYMRFNAGRSEAYRSMPELVRVVPAGTCVGHAGHDLVVHAIATDEPFAAVENPRQRPAWLYSTRYGPVAPTFTRASRTESLLLASGTAAVVGEDSIHLGDLEAQFAETVANLRSLAEAGGGDGRWRSLQIYVRDPAHLAAVRALARAHFGEAAERILHAPLCRRELLVEVEGICHVAIPHA